MLQNVWDPLFLPNILVTNDPTIQDVHKWMLCQPSFSSQSPNFGTAQSPNFSYSRRNTEQTSITRFSRSPSLPPSRRLTMNHALAIIFTTLSTHPTQHLFFICSVLFGYRENEEK